MLSQKPCTLDIAVWLLSKAEGMSAIQEYNRWVTPGSKYILMYIKQDLKIVLFK